MYNRKEEMTEVTIKINSIKYGFFSFVANKENTTVEEVIEDIVQEYLNQLALTMVGTTNEWNSW